MLGWLLGPYVKHLESEIAWLRQQAVSERVRAERAIDALLALKGAVAITPTPSEVRDANSLTPEETPSQTATRLLNDQEFMSAGSV